jgi:hypothetical protein
MRRSNRPPDAPAAFPCNFLYNCPPQLSCGKRPLPQRKAVSSRGSPSRREKRVVAGAASSRPFASFSPRRRKGGISRREGLPLCPRERRSPPSFPHWNFFPRTGISCLAREFLPPHGNFFPRTRISSPARDFFLPQGKRPAPAPCPSPAPAPRPHRASGTPTPPHPASPPPPTRIGSA